MKWLKKALGPLASKKGGRKVAEDLVTRGYIAAHEGRLEQARALYIEACDADPTLAVAFFNAGQVELELFNKAGSDDDVRASFLTGAAHHLQQALALQPDHPPTWRTLARVHERNRAFVAAVDAWTQARARLVTAEPPADPQDLEEARREAQRLQPFAELEAALKAARQALQVDVDVDAAGGVLLALRATWERCAPVVGGDGVEPSRLFTLLGALARKAQQTELARGFFEQAIARDKHDLEALKELATICMAQGDLKAALTSSMAAYRADPVDAGLVCNVGVCHLALGELDKAREFIELAAGMAPKDAIVLRAVAALSERR